MHKSKFILWVLSSFSGLSVYYCLKPFMPKSLQLYLRRLRCRAILQNAADVWPIFPQAGRGPVDWKGWPEGKQFAVVLTHDVENIRGVKKVQKLVALEKGLGFRSSFNFVARDYPFPESLSTRLKADGFEIGLHGLHHNNDLYRSESVFRKTAKAINFYLAKHGSRGFRSPAMYHNLDWIHNLNILYDASTFDTDPFEPQPDGVGTIFPFWVPSADGSGGYVELPYTLPQDFSLFILLEEKSPAIWKKKLDWIAESGGMALVIVHPDYMDFHDRKSSIDEYPAEYYSELLEYIRSQYSGRYWNALPREVAEWCVPNDGLGKSITHDIRPSVQSPKRVCMLTYSFYENDNRVRRYSETLVREGYQVDVICLKGAGQGRNGILNGVNLIRAQMRERDETKPADYFRKIVLFLFRSGIILTLRHLRKKYDLIHVHNIPDFLVFAALIPKLLGCKVILDIHDIVPELYQSKFSVSLDSKIFKMLCFKEKLCASFANYVIVANKIWQERICSRSVNINKCITILNYPDDAMFHQLAHEKEDDRDIFIYPGTLSHHQGLDIAIKALALIQDRFPKADIHIYGGGPSLKPLAGLVSRFGLEKRVLFKGSLPIEQVGEAISKALCGIVPKRSDCFANEAFSTKILEFMAVGLPVIVSDTKIDKYYFNDSVVLFFQSGNAEDMAAKMAMILESATLRQQLINSSSIFVQNFRWEKNKKIYIDLIESIKLF
jgi:glycosyltransferase involved in cell wall biosynthesis/peptidoglycan/xylan/chitin deacetylase (PgdA/CDA1 family)